jgi:PAS domain S-box-containing protein
LRWFARPLLLAVAVLLMLFGATGFLGFQYWHERQAANLSLEHSRQVLDTLDRLRTIIANLEAERRGYLLTLDPAYLKAYGVSDESVRREAQALQALVASDPLQSLRAEHLALTISATLREIDDIVRTPRTSGLTALAMMRNMDEIRSQIDQMVDHERFLLADWEARAAALEQRKTWLIAVAAVIVTVLAGTALALARLEARQRRKATEENVRLHSDLKRREKKIRRLVDANIIGIVIWDLEGRILEANDAFLRIVGYDREDLATGRVRWTDLTPPEWLDRDARQWVPELERTGILPPFEKEYFRKDGSRVPVLIGAATFEEGANQGVAFVLDLTERKRAEEELRRSEAYLAEAEALSKSGSWAWNPTTKEITYWSKERYRLFGFDPKAGIPSFEALLQRIHPEDREKWLENAERAVQIRGDSETDFRIVLPDGEIKHLHGIGHPVYSETGELLEIIGAVMDITERKRAEEALQKAQAELAHVTRVTTMSALTASIAHEVNQPLAAIVANANAALRWLARQPPNLAEVRETLGRIVQDGHRAGAVIGRVRALLRKTATVKERLDLNELIRDTIALVHGQVRRHRILLRTELAQNLPPVVGDRVQLQQVLLNLVLNGLEAMKEVAERPRELLIRSQPDEAGAVLVAVQDTGVGLDPQQVERVFEAFYTTKPEGLGMGLAICRSIIEAHGGQLWASANKPRGAVFQFTLPAEQDETIPAEHAGQSLVV